MKYISQPSGRNGHSYNEWRDTYQVEACQRHARAWQRLSREAQRSCVIEDLLLLWSGMSAAPRRARRWSLFQGRSSRPGAGYGPCMPGPQADVEILSPPCRGSLQPPLGELDEDLSRQRSL